MVVPVLSGRPLRLAVSLLSLLTVCGSHAEPAPLSTPDTAALGAGSWTPHCAVQAQEALRAINAARAAGHRCGWKSMPPAPPLRWDASLYSAARGHSQDMAKRNYFEHRSPEGRTVAERVNAAHYRWKTVGENLAGGDRSIGSAVQGWLDSPAHCENMLNPKFADVAVACVADTRSQWGTYWTMVLGLKR